MTRITSRFHRIARSGVFLACFVASLAAGAHAANWDPAAADYSGNKGKTLYVSKLGDNSDGSSWEKAFHTIQAALLAVPDDKGGHRVVIRPDTYDEANLYPTFAGAAGSYNLLVGDFDGSLGSGATGWVVIDSGCPKVIVRTDPNAPDRQSDVQDRRAGHRGQGRRAEERRLVGAVAVRTRLLRRDLGPLDLPPPLRHRLRGRHRLGHDLRARASSSPRWSRTASASAASPGPP